MYLTKPFQAVSHGRGVFKTLCLREGFSPTYSTPVSCAHNSFTPTLDTLHPIQMAHFNNANNASIYSTSSTSGEPHENPHLNRTLATDTWGEVSQTYVGPSDRWRMARRPGPMVGSPTSLRAAAGFSECHSNRSIGWCLTHRPAESVDSVTTYTTRTDGDAWPSYDWSADYEWAQSHRSSFLSRDRPLASTAVSETSTAMPAPGSGEYISPLPEELGTYGSRIVPLDDWGVNRGGASAGAFHIVSA